LNEPIVSAELPTVMIELFIGYRHNDLRDPIKVQGASEHHPER